MGVGAHEMLSVFLPWCPNSRCSFVFSKLFSPFWNVCLINKAANIFYLYLVLFRYVCLALETTTTARPPSVPRSLLTLLSLPSSSVGLSCLPKCLWSSLSCLACNAQHLYLAYPGDSSKPTQLMVSFTQCFCCLLFFVGSQQDGILSSFHVSSRVPAMPLTRYQLWSNFLLSML